MAMSAKTKKLLADRNLDIDQAMSSLGISDFMLEDKTDREIANYVKTQAERYKGNRQAELIAIILRESLKDLPNDEPTAAEFHRELGRRG